MKSSNSVVIKSTQTSPGLPVWAVPDLNKAIVNPPVETKNTGLPVSDDDTQSVTQPKPDTGERTLLGIQVLLSKPVNYQKHGNLIQADACKEIKPQAWSWGSIVMNQPAKTQKTRKIRETSAGLSGPSQVQDESDYKDRHFQGSETIKLSQQKALEKIAQAEAEVDKIRQKAYLEGIELGRKETLDTIRAAQGVLNEIQIWWANYMQKSEPVVIQMIQAIAQKMFSQGFILDVNVLQDVVGNAIGEASRLGNLRVYMHPEDVQTLITLWQDAEITLNGQRIQLVSSQNLLRGGCFIEGEFGSVDGRIETQMRTIDNSLNTTLLNKQQEERENNGT